MALEAVENYEEDKEEVQMSFEGIAVSGSRLTVSAFQVIPNGPMRQFDQIEFQGRATILEISHKGNAQEQTSERKYVAVVDGAEITEHHPR